MTVNDLISRPDLTLIPDGNKLRVRGNLTDEDRELIRTHKQEIINRLTGQIKARGYGCAGCGNKIYEAVQAWEISELPESAEFKHEHTLVINWQCEGCGAVFEMIGGSREPQIIN